MTRRVCFLLQVRPDRVAEYRKRHLAVWPEMREALSATGWRNYSLFLREDGLLVGYLECEDFDEARAAMDATAVNARWQAEMQGLFEELDGQRPDERMRPLLAELRQELGLDPDPIAAYGRSGYAGKIAAERVGGQQAGWGA